MNARALLASILLLLCLPAAAEKLEVEVTPKALQAHGFSLKTDKRDNGHIGFTITRDLAKAQWPGRTAYLKVQGEGGLLAECKVAPERKGNQVTYWFSLAPPQVAHSRFTLWE